MIGEKRVILGGLLLAGSMCIANAQSAVNLSGKLTNGSTNAVVVGAKVTVVGNPTITAVTDAQGNFTLTGNATVGIGSGLNAGKSEMALAGTQLSFSVAEDNTPVTVDVFNMKNQFVRNLVSRKASAGEYTVDAAPAGLTNGMYVVRARIGSQTAAFKMTTLGLSSGKGFQALANTARAGLAKAAADPIDSLLITKEGFKPKSVAITKYSGILSLTINPKLPAGDLKLISERQFPQVAWGKNVDVGVFDGGTQLEGNWTAEFFEGGKCWKVAFQETQLTHGWGFMTTVEPEDMSAWKGGTMHMAVRGTVTSLSVTMESYDQGAGFSRKVDLAKYGYAPMTSISDLAWHEVVIPLDEFEGTDLSQVKVYLGLSYPSVTDTAPFDPSLFYMIDDVYWSLKK